jgi:hypothetical protein
MLKERTQGSIGRGGNEVCGVMRHRTSSTDWRAYRPAFGAVAAIALVSAIALAGGQAKAEVINNPIAVFAALDKVTGRISHLEIPIDKTVKFGALKVTPRVCDTRPPTEPPHTASFVEVDEVKLTGEEQRIFTGWMFAESPGLHAVEHPVFDVWLTSCKTPPGSKPEESAENAEPAEEAPAPPPAAAEAAPPPAAPPPAAAAAQPAPEAAAPLPWLVPNASSRRR